MSYNKLNVFHWHIVDDNSFPYQSIRFPELADKGAFHRSMVYTPGDVQKVIEHARYRGIRVIPEFDTPGHTRSWGESHPELLTACYGQCPPFFLHNKVSFYNVHISMMILSVCVADSAGRTDGTLGPFDPTAPTLYQFLRELFAEIVNTFPDPYVHLGGDEVPFDCWASNPQIRAYMHRRGFNDSYQRLEEEYIQQLLNITWSLNASSIVWQEVRTSVPRSEYFWHSILTAGTYTAALP